MSDENPYASPAAPATPSAEPPRLLDIRIDPAQAIVAEGMLTAEDFFAAQKLHRSVGRTRTWILLAALVFAAQGGVTLFLGEPFGWGGIFIVAVVLYLGAAVLFFPRLSARSVWKNSPTLREPLRRLITSEVMQTITPSSNVMLSWSLFAHYRSSRDLVLLYLTEHPRLFLVIPRRMFRSDDDWRRFVEIVAERLPKA